MKRRTGHLFKNSGNHNWILRYKINGKVFVRSTGETARSKAAAWAEKHMSGMQLADEREALLQTQARLAGVDTRARAIAAHDALLVENLYEAYVKMGGTLNRTVSADSIESKIKIFARWLDAEYPRIKLASEVSETIARDFMLGYIKRQRAPKTFNEYRMTLLRVWKLLAQRIDPARETGAASPWAAIPKMKFNRLERRRRAFAREELEVVLKSLAGEDRMAAIIGLFTGQRLETCVLLKWSAVDFETNTIVATPGKTAKHDREPLVLPLLPALREELITWKGTRPSKSPYILPDCAAQHLAGSDATSHRFQRLFNRLKMPMYADGIGKGLNGACKCATVSFHSFRHTFVTLAIQAGVHPEIVRRITGHDSDEMRKHYTHITPEMLMLAPQKSHEPSIEEMRRVYEAVKAKPELMRQLAVDG